MKITHFLFVAIAALVQPVLSYGQQPKSGAAESKKAPVDAGVKAKINQWLLNSHGLRFVENKGQMTDLASKPVKDLLFEAGGNGVEMYVTTDGISYVFQQNKISKKVVSVSQGSTNLVENLYRADMELVGANIRKENIVKDIESKDYSNYYIGTGPGVTNVHTYERVTVKNIYPGIDWVLYTADGTDNEVTGKAALQYDFVVHPGADPSVIKLRYKWTDKPEMEKDGSMKISIPVGDIKEGTPVSHSIGGDKNIHTEYTLADREVGFAVSNYDKSKTIVIDPLLTWSTLLGGANPAANATKGAAIWSDGAHVFVGGTTTATNFPMTNGGSEAGYKSTSTSGSQLMFIAEFTASSGVPVFATYFGGTANSESDYLQALTGDPGSGGNIWVAGNTNTGNASFPVTNPGGYDFYETSSTIGFTPAGFGYSGNCYLGAANVFTPLNGTNVISGPCPVVMEFSKSNGSILYATFMGGGSSGTTNGDNCRSLWDDGTSVWMTGYTSTSNFPNFFQTGYYHAATGTASSAPFIVEFAAVANGVQAAGNLVWSTWLGTGAGVGYDVCSDGSNVYLTGVVSQAGLPVSNPGGGAFYQSALPGASASGFICQFNIANIANGAQPAWCTYYGGSGTAVGTVASITGLSATVQDQGNDIYCDGSHVWVAGFTGSSNLASTPANANGPILTSPGAAAYFTSTNAVTGVRPFIAEFNESNDAPVWGTYYGGTATGETSEPTGLNKDINGSVWVSGFTNSSSFPVQSASTSCGTNYYKSTLNGTQDEWVAQFDVNGIRHWSSYVAATAGNETDAIGGGNATTKIGGGHGVFSDGAHLWMTGFTTTSSFPTKNPGTAYLKSTISIGSTNGFIVDFTDLLYASVSPSPASVCLGGPVTLTASGSGGTSPFTYTWASSNTSNPAPATTGLTAGSYTLSVTPTQNTTYTLTVTDAGGACSTVAVAVNSASTFSVTISAQTNVNCNGGTTGAATASPSGGSAPFSYSWSTSPVQTTATATGLSAGTYTVTANGTPNCNSSSATVTITQPPLLSATTSILTNVSCNGLSNGSATANPTGGTSPYTYSWATSPVQTNSTATGLSAGIYTVTVKGNLGCTTTANVTITQPAILTVTTTQTAAVTCGQNNGSDSAIVGGGTSPYTYLWTPTGGTGVTGTGLGVGSYTVTVTDNDGCVQTSSAVLSSSSNLSATISVTNVSCNGGSNGTATASPTGGTSPYTYSWNNGQTNSTATGLAIGTYTITLTDNNGCLFIGTTVITQPLAIGISASTTANVNCFAGNTGSASSTASGGTSPYTYSWSDANSQTTTVATGLIAGTYTVMVTGSQGCTATASVIITQPASALGITISSATNINCFGGSTGTALANAATGGTSPYTYLWSPSGGTTLNATGLSAGTYVINVTDNHGCTATVSATLSQPTAALGITIASVSTILCPAGTGTVTANAATGGTAPYTYSWSGAGGTNLSATVTAGTYIITVKDNNGCTAIASANITQPTAIGLTISSVTNIACFGGTVGSATVTINAQAVATFSYEAAVQHFTVPAGVSTITVAIAGAQGGGTTGGDGASFTGLCTVTPGDVLGVAVGQQGITNVTYGQGGGGASWVYDSTVTGLHSGTPALSALLAVAAGGGGESRTTVGAAGAAGGTNLATNLTVASAGGSYAGGTLGAGGSSSTTTAGAGGGGAGWVGNGISGTLGTPDFGGSGGNDWSNNFSGGSGGTEGGAGGYGGGGQAGASAGGGGAGYNGGGGGTAFSTTFGEGGGGGGSYLSGTTLVAASSLHTGNGLVTISYPSVAGTPPYTYSWSGGGGTNITISGVSAGTYTLTVTDNNGCNATIAATITQPAGPLGGLNIASVTNIPCFGGSGSATANTATGGTSPYTYSWAPSGGTSLTTTAIGAGTYTLTVTDNHGCTATSSTFATITQPASSVGGLAITLVTNPNCNGGTGSAIASAATGGTSPYTYSWSGGLGSNLTVNTVAPGSYTLTATDNNGCSTTVSVTITQPAFALTSIISSVTNVLCTGGTTGSITASLASLITQNFSYEAAVQHFTIPAGVSTLTVAVAGAKGGGSTGGNGASFSGACAVVPGDILSLAVGGLGGTSTLALGNGGGGGTFVYDSNQVVILGPATAATSGYLYAVAAGGGGAGISSAGGVGGTTIASPYTAVNGTGGNGTNGTLGAGGSAGTGNNDGAGGGAGWIGNGANGTTSGFGTNHASFGGNDQASHFLGGAVTTGEADVNSGGYGGGGGGGTEGGGGGGGYNGGGGGTGNGFSIFAGGGGGGSYFVTGTTNITVAANTSNTGNGSASISYRGAGGTSPYTYSWAPSGGTNITATGLSAGTYTLTVTDNHGCTSTVSATISQPASPIGISIASVTNILCNGGTGKIVANAATGGTSPYTYLWSPSGGTNLTASGLSAGVYTITVTGNAGCTATASATITQPPLLSILTSVTNIACGGHSTGTASVSATGGVSPYTYSWSGGGGTNTTASNLSAGTYTIVVTGNQGCTASASVTVTQPTPLLAIATSPLSATCNQSNGADSVTVSGGISPYTYRWSDAGSQTTVTASNLSAGIYTVTVTDNTGCTTTAFSQVNNSGAPISTISNITNESCFGGNNGSATVSASGGVIPYTYLWSDAASQTNVTATGLTAGVYFVTVTDNTGCFEIVAATLTQPAAISVSTSATTNVTCNAGTNGSALATASGGTPPYTYSWNNGQTTASATGLGAGTYTIIVTGNQGCTGTATVIITQPTPIGITISTVNNIACFGGRGNATANAATGGVLPYTYSWSGAAGTNLTATNLAVGTYTITATDNHGCATTGLVTITQPAAALSVSISSSSNVGCNTPGSATASPAGGTAPYTYSWSGGAGTNQSASLSAGTYTVTATDNHGCTGSVSVIITNTSLNLTVVPTPEACNGASTGSVIVIASAGTSPYTYIWSPGGQSSSTISALSAGSYTITVVDNAGCIATAVTSITQPTAIGITISSVTNIACFGGTGKIVANAATGGTSPYTYSWAPSGGTGLTASALSAGIYTLTVKDNHGCTGTISATITQPSSALTVTAIASNILCRGGSGSATANPSGGTLPYTYSWSGGGGNSQTTIALTAGTYTITVTDNNGCLAQASATITQPAAALGITIVSVNNILCNGAATGNATASAATGGTLPYTYLWSPSGGTSLTTIGVSAGTYTLTVTDNHGCLATASATITQNTAVGITRLSRININCNGASTGVATANAATGGISPYTYSWSSGAGTNLVASNLSAGTYTITATDNNGCTGTAAFTITQNPAISGIVAQVSAASCGQSNGSIMVSSVSGGKSPYTYLWSDVNSQSTVTATGLSAGVYTVTITDSLGCTQTLNGTLNNATGPSITIANSTNVSCNGGNNGSVTVSVTGGTSPYTYSWNNGQTTTTNSGLTAGIYFITVTDNQGCFAITSDTIRQPAVLGVSTGITNINCFGFNNGTASATVSGGTIPYTYSWSNSQSAANATGLSAGTYSIMVTDHLGCTATSSVSISQPASALGITIASSTNISCFGGSGSATANAATGGTSPYTYSWTPVGGTNLSVSSLNAGTYTITTTDNHGCTATASVTITSPASALGVTISSVANVLCNGSTGSATASVSGGSLPYTYLWSGGGGTNSTAIVSAGTYTVSVTDNHGCTTSASATLTQPASSIGIVGIASVTNILCNGGTGIITATQNPLVTVAFSYESAAQHFTVPSSVSTVTVAIAGAQGGGTAGGDGASFTGLCTVTPGHVLSIAVGQQPATNATYASGGGGASWIYDSTAQPGHTGIPLASNLLAVAAGGGGQSYSGGFEGTIAGAAAGTSLATNITTTLGTGDDYAGGTGGAGGSSATGTVGVGGGGAGWISNGGSGTITTPDFAGSGGGYWGNTTPFSGGSTGTEGGAGGYGGGGQGGSEAGGGGAGYNGGGGGEIAGGFLPEGGGGGGSYLLGGTANQLGTPVATKTGNGSASITYVISPGGTPPYTYSWSGGGGTNITATGITAGTYTLTVTDNNGCTTTTSATLTQPTAVGTTIASVTNVLCNGNSTGRITATTATGGVSPYTYSWSPSGGTTVTATGLSAGIYTIKVTDHNGCTGSAFATITQPATAVAISISSVTSIACGGGSTGSATANAATGGTSPYTYSWSGGGGTNLTATGLNAGVYIITAKDNSGCSATASATITQSIPISVSIASVSNVSCNQGTLTAAVTGIATQSFNYESAIQHFTVPAGVTSLTVSVSGAQGGGATGGDGASFAGICTVTPGDVLGVVVGQQGITNTTYANGGGGASWVYDSTAQPGHTGVPSLSSLLAVAAGGGGQSYTGGFVTEPGAAAGINLATNATTTSTSASYAGGTGGAGGTTSPTTADVGGGGAGWISNGASGIAATGGSGGGYWGNATPFGGGSTGIEGGAGGYGGGGQGGAEYGGGGAGYNGGGGGEIFGGFEPGGGGGGGSYLNGTVSGTPVATRTGNGIVTISYPAVGGTPPYTYSWAPSGGTNLTTTTVSAGTYTISVTDNSGCTTTASGSITQPPVIAVNISSVTNVLCNGGTGNATATLALNFQAVKSFSYEAAVQHFTIPAGVATVTVSVSGAQGGGATGGNGASFAGICTVTPGDVLGVVVGQQGITNTTYANGGGGASWIYDSTAQPGHTGVPSLSSLLAVAAGGGGQSYTGGFVIEPGAAAGINLATNATTTSTSASYAGGTGGAGGTTSPTTADVGGGGAGWISNGASGIAATGGSGGGYWGNATPFGGGSTGIEGGAGGYGGGGQGGAEYGGGGAGYNGGGGGEIFGGFEPGGGGGGGSYLNGTVSGTPVATRTGNGIVTISYPAVGGTSPYTYSWSGGGGTNLTTTFVVAGTYTLTTTDNLGCTATTVATITQPAVLSATVSATANVSCFGGTNGNASSNTTGGTSPYTYSWSNGSTTTVSSSNPTGAILSAGTYTVSIIDNNGCTTTASGIITQPPVVGITILSVSNILCTTGSGSITANMATGGTSPYTYSWTPSGGSGITGTGLSGGTYTVTVTDNHGCTATASASITQPSSLGISVLSVTNVNCNGATGSATANAATGGLSPYTYSWSGGGGTSLTTVSVTAGTYTITVNDNNGCSAIATATITQPTALGISILSVSNVLCNGQTGTVTANAATGGTSPYTYNWSPSGGSGLTASVSAGTYTITVIDNHGCFALATATVTQPVTNVSAIITTQTNILCNGSSTGSATGFAFNGTAPYTYSWSPSGGTGLTASGLSAGTYSFDVTDNNGCSFTATATITQPASALGVSIASVGNVTCNGGAGSAAANAATGGTSPYTYAWSPAGGTNLNASGLSAGVYEITVTDNNGCTATAGATITQPAATGISIASVSNILCNGGSGSITANAGTGGVSPYTYSWSAGGSSLTASGLSAGTYTITMEDSNGCTASATATITQPASALGISIASVSNISCNAGSGSATAAAATGGTSPYTYSWAPAGGSSLSATGLSAGTYTIVATDNHGCMASATATVTQPASSLGITLLSVNNISCNGGTGSATANAATGGASPYTYAWAPAGGTNVGASGLSAGIYTLTVTDNHGCTAVATATITQPSALGISLSTVINAACNGGSGSATANAATGGTSPYTYSWSAGAGSTLAATGLSAGTYTISVEDSNGCIATASATITQPTGVGVSIVSVSNVVCNGGTGSATAGTATGGIAPYTYQWNDGSSQNGITATGLSAGTYTVTASDNNGCMATAAATVTQPASALGITLSSVTNALCLAGTGSATANAATGGISPYTYSWSPAGGTNLSATGLSAGIYAITVTDNHGCTAAASATITQSGSTLGISIGSVTNVLCNGGNGSITANTATGGASPYTYSWTPYGGISQTATVSAGTYTVMVTDNNGCTAAASATVTQPSAVGISLSSVNNVGCYGGNGTLTANAATGGTQPYTYTWSPNGGSNLTTTALTAGRYTIIAIDNNGCTATASGTITQPGSPLGISIASVSNALCNGGTGSVTANAATGGISPYTYSWSAGGGTDLTAILSAGTYTITATDNNGCMASASATITQAAYTLGITISSVTNVACYGGTGTATANAASGGVAPFTYSWSPAGGTDLVATGISAGIYTITAADANGCIASASATISQPTAIGISIASVVNVLCSGGNGSLTANAATGGVLPYTYNWSPAGGTDLSATGVSAGTYVITVTDNNGCSASAAASITQPLSGLGINIVSVSNIICNGGSGSVTANSATGGTAPYTYSWSPTGGTDTVANVSAGTYTILVTDNNGCTATAAATVTQNAAVVITIASVSNIECFGQIGSISANPATGGTSPYTYSWSSGGGSNLNVNYLNPGTYTLTVSDNNGCMGTVSATITQPPLLGISMASVSNVLCYGGTGTLTANAATGGLSPYTYTWSPSGGNNLTTSSVSAGVYTVIVIDNHGCTATASATITQPASAVGISIASVSNVLCNGGSGSATANAATGGISPYTYSWSGGGGSNLSAGLSAGTYTISAMDNNGCIATATVTVTQPASVLGISIASVTNISCGIGSGSATANAATGGTAPYTYLWSDGSSQATLTATGLSAGTYTISVSDNNGCTATATATITQPASSLGVSISGVTNVSCNGGTGSASASASGGSSPYTYLWNDSRSQATASATGLLAGTYTISVTDNNGCNAVATATITQPSALGISIASVSNVLCNGGSGSATANAATGGTSPYTYTWNDGSSQTALTATGLTAGSYTITVIDNNGCSTTASAIITQPASALGISIASVTNISCGIGSGSATANAATGGTAPYTYLWSDGSSQATLTATGLSAGTYTISVSDNNGCTATATATITQPASSLGVSISGVTNVSCNGGTGSASASASGGSSPYTYLWNDSRSQATASATGLLAGTYTISVTDNNGCNAVATATITQPSALGISIASVSNVLCNGGSGSATANAATGGTSPYTYTWNDGSSQTALTATGLTAGSYTITVIDNNGCSTTASAIITQPASALGISIASVTNISCGIGSGSATANAATGGTAPYTYLWSDGSSQATLTATGLSAGTYTISVSDNNGCTATATATITQPASSLGVSISGVTNVSCNGGTGSASASASGGSSPYTYEWNDGSSQATATATGLSAGTYSVTVTDNNGCSGTAAATISQPANALAVTTAVSSSVSCNGLSNGSGSVSVSGGSAPYTYSWSNGATGTSISGVSAGTYTVLVSDNNGCSATGSMNIGQPNSLTATTVASVNVSCNGGANGQGKVSAAGGSSPYTYSWSPNSNSSYLSTGLSAGTYTVTITDRNGCSTSGTVTVTQPAVLRDSIASVSYPGCAISTGSATIGVRGGTSPYIYSWTPNVSSTATATGLTVRSYTVLVKDAKGCYNYLTVSISQPPALRDSIVSASTVNVTCGLTNNGSAKVGVKYGTAPYTYSWTPGGATTAAASGLTVGTYTVTVRDANTCSVSATVVIGQTPGLTLTAIVAANITCNGNANGQAKVTVTGGYSPYTYSWTPGGNSTYITTGLSAGTYSVTVTDKYGCTNVATVTLSQPASIRDSVSSISYPACYAGGGSATIGVKGGTSPYHYSWTPNVSTTATATGLTARSYSVQVKDNNGCYNTVIFTITQPAVVRDSIVRAATVNVLCNGSGTGSATVGVKYGSSPFTYSWSPGGGSNATATGLSARIYTVTVKDGCANTATASVTITQPSALRDSISSSTCNSGLITATAGVKGGVSPYTYSWSPNTSSTARATGLSAGSYTVTITDKNGCSIVLNASLNCGATVLETNTNDGSPAAQCCPPGTIYNVNLYPNPNSGQFTIAGVEKGMTVEVYDYTGRKVSVISVGDITLQLNISGEPNGVYLVRILDKDGNLISEKKVVKVQ